MWTPKQVKEFQRALAVAQKWKEPIEHLQQIAKHAPAFEGRVEQLRLMRDNLEALSAAALAIDSEGQRK